MADYLTTDTELTSVANAIRTKGGTSASLVYPTGFVSAINAISTGTDVSDTTAAASDVRTGKYFYTSAGTKTQGTIADQAAQTIHPSATDQTIASGKYLTGTQTVKGVLLTNLDAGNIKKDVVVKVGDSTDDDCVTSVTGTYEGGGGGGVDEFIANHGTMTEYTGTASIIGAGAFAWCANLVSASFPNCESIGNNAFQDSAKLLSVDFPLCSYIGNSAFQNCKSLVTINFPNCESVNTFAFYNCTRIVMASFSMCKIIWSSAFYNCSSLTTAYFPSCTTIHSNAFYGCYRLTDVTFTNCKTLHSYVFNACSSLATVSLPNCSTINGQVFSKCVNLLSLYLLGSHVAKLSNTNAFYSTPISNYTTSTGGVQGSIFVPSSLYSTYIASTNWVTYAARFVSV